MHELFEQKVAVKDGAGKDTGHTVVFAGRVSMTDYRAWVKAEDANDDAVCWAFMARVVKEWDYVVPGDNGGVIPLDPSDPASFGKLDLREYRGVNVALGKWLRQEADPN